MISGGNASSLPLVGGLPEPTIKELSKPGRRAFNYPILDIEEVTIEHECLKIEKAPLPEVSEHDLVMHFSRLAHRNFGVDLGFYPLGSCTMKYNPRFADWAASLDGFSNLHPAAPQKQTQGALEILNVLEDYLIKITGMDYASFQPPAGASGELTGLLIIKKYLIENDMGNKKNIIVITCIFEFFLVLNESVPKLRLIPETGLGVIDEVCAAIYTFNNILLII